MRAISLNGQRLERGVSLAPEEGEAERTLREKTAGAGGGCLATVVMVIGISAGFVTAIFSMLSAL